MRKRIIAVVAGVVALVAVAVPGVAGAALIQGDDTANVLHGTASADIIKGYAGDDLLRGLGGRDLLRPGVDEDIANSNRGRDVLKLRDGYADQGNCGNAYDVAFVDAKVPGYWLGDWWVPAYDLDELRNCEEVHYPDGTVVFFP